MNPPSAVDSKKVFKKYLQTNNSRAQENTSTLMETLETVEPDPEVQKFVSASWLWAGYSVLGNGFFVAGVHVSCRQQFNPIG